MTSSFIYSLDAGLQISAGLIPNLEREFKYGRNPNIASGVVSDIWDYGGTGNQPIYVFPDSAGEDMTISSDLGTDTSAGAGARTAQIYGLDTNFNLYNVVLSLDGQNAVAIPEKMTSVHRIIIRTDGSSGLNANLGNVYVGSGAVAVGKPANVFAMIAVGNGRTLMTPYMVPAGRTAFIYKWNASIIKPPSDSSASLLFKMKPFEEVFQVQDSIGLVTDGDNNENSDLWECSPLPIFEKSQIKIEATTLASSFIIDAKYIGFLRKN